MANGPTFSAARGPGLPMSALDAIATGAREFAGRLYQLTATEPRALGVAIADDLFVRVALMHADRTAGQPDAETSDAIEARGHLDLELAGLRVRIISERALGRGDGEP
jgi:hypothetical protein